ncbi:MAG: hypothetical protein M9938_09665 [Solirubrobacterales bacterium]|nr:hypothetical protein [Solirubrobacterales bacterium]
MNPYNENHHSQQPGGPGGISWFFQQIGWYLRKLILWPIADSFRWVGRGIGRFFGAFRHRSPFAYIGATLAVTVTAGAVAAAYYFYKQAEPGSPAAPQATPTEVATPTPPAVPTTTPPAVAEESPDTLQGVVPNFRNTAARAKNRKRAAEKAVVKPSPAPKGGPLRVAHQFATAFTGYEVGGKQAARRLGQTASPKLARELKANPPKLPVNGSVPKASVMNVVPGKREGRRLAVSVALVRAGAASELRLGLTRTGSGWRVSEVRG